MKKRNNKHEKRVKRMIVACGLCAIILSMSTYAWFIGMKTVSVSSFDVKVASTDSLLLSLDGKTWDTSVDINPGTDTYEGNTNIWAEGGLIPMSSVGKIDTATSRLELYEKGSLTATPGGYRLLASKVKNDGATEAKGYVAFDLFVKNLSGEEYYPNDNILNEEAIYLTPESSVKVKSTADDKQDKTGIENSVRIAFAQIGRVKATTTDDTLITGMTCNKGETPTADVTGICRDAQIWEPNDTKHVGNAIKWYQTSCKARKAGADGKDITLESAYDGTCGTIVDGTAYPTYAISGEVDVDDKVDVYDGAEYNTYTESALLQKFDKDNKYFTDTMKDYKGTARPQLISLAPNSITKVRVYIWLEGQDIDNYDFASLGKTISVAFGFTKEQLYGEDINYTPDPTLPAEVDKRPEATPSTAEPTPTP